MAKFSDLPLETLLDIIEWSLQSCGHPYDHFLQLNNLSLVCKYFHDITAPKIFRRYRLQLREASQKLGAPDPTCFLTLSPLLTWNQVGVDARLAHLRKNAAFVRDLRIIDWGQSFGRVYFGFEPGPAPFDPTLMPVLLDTLFTLTGVVSVTFEATKQDHRCTQFPVELWHWLSRIKPAKLSFDGWFSFPPSLEPLHSVQSMSLWIDFEAARVIDAVRPEHLELGVEAADKVNYQFKDVFHPYPSLKQLEVWFRYYGDWMPAGYFDFTSCPDAELTIQMSVLDIDVYIEAPGSWDATEERLEEAFVDDLTKLDIRRDDGSDTFVISRPPPGSAGGIRDLHLPETVEVDDIVLGFEQAVFAALPDQQLLDGPIDAAFWTHLDAVFEKVYSQTFEALTGA